MAIQYIGLYHAEKGDREDEKQALKGYEKEKNERPTDDGLGTKGTSKRFMYSLHFNIICTSNKHTSMSLK